MSVLHNDLPDEVRGRIDEHLDAVEQVMLKAGASRQERRSVEEDLRAQILEQLGARCGGRAPGVGDAEAVLGGMDSPESYGEDGGRAGREAKPSSVDKPRVSGMAVAGLVLVVVGLMPMLAYLVMAVYLAARAEKAGSSMHLEAELPLWTCSLTLMLIGAVLGVGAIRQIKRSKGMIRGMPLAVIDVAVPVIVVIMILFALLNVHSRSRAVMGPTVVMESPDVFVEYARKHLFVGPVVITEGQMAGTLKDDAADGFALRGGRPARVTAQFEPGKKEVYVRELIEAGQAFTEEAH